MKTKLTLLLGSIFVATLAAVGTDPQPAPCPEGDLICYEVEPGDTDLMPRDASGNQPDCPDTEEALGIGCENRWTTVELGELAINKNHILYLDPDLKHTGKLLVFLPGDNGDASGPRAVYPVAARQGYHVIGLTYPAGRPAQCKHEESEEDQLACFGNMLNETVTGVEGALPGGQRTNVSEHDQDSIINRLIRVLEWADVKHPHDGWNRFLTSGGEVRWNRVHLAGFSNGSTHASYMGTLPELREVGRIALFAGPNDGFGDSSDDWASASFIQLIKGVTDTRYYGLVHERNNAKSELASANVLYEVTNNWQKFGMEDSPNRARFAFIPSESTSPAYFDGARMLINIDQRILARDAHRSTIRERYCTDPDSDEKCTHFDGDLIGYGPAWRCILGTGNSIRSSAPTANAGPHQTVECQGNGGANVDLNGSGSRDLDCDVLSETWTGPFGTETTRSPTVFLPLGTSDVTLEVSDGWPSSSSSDTTSITVRDTQPPTLHVTLTPTLLWPADHRLVRIDATVSAADSCGDAQPQIRLTSIMSDQPDNGTGDGDTQIDIQEAAIGTFDTSFFLRADRAGGDPLGRTYTVTYRATDASGNWTDKSATVHVPRSR